MTVQVHNQGRQISINSTSVASDVVSGYRYGPEHQHKSRRGSYVDYRIYGNARVGWRRLASLYELNHCVSDFCREITQVMTQRTKEGRLRFYFKARQQNSLEATDDLEAETGSHSEILRKLDSISRKQSFQQWWSTTKEKLCLSESVDTQIIW